MNLERTEVFIFTKVPRDHQMDRAELFAHQAIKYGQPVLCIVPNSDHYAYLNARFGPNNPVAFIRGDADSLRSMPLPSRMAIIVDPDVPKEAVTLLLNKALRNKAGITYVS